MNTRADAWAARFSLFFSILFFAISMLCFFIALIAGIDWCENPQSKMPEGVPAGRALDDFLVCSPNMDNVGVAPLGDWKRFSFHGIEAIGGLWRVDSAKFKVTANGAGDEVGRVVVTDPLHSDVWGVEIQDQSDKRNVVPPPLDVTVLVPPSSSHTWVNVDAEMDVTYPHFSSGGQFYNKTEPLKASYRFFVLTPSDYQALKDFRERKDAADITFMAGGGGLVLLVASYFAWRSFRAGGHSPRSSS